MHIRLAIALLILTAPACSLRPAGEPEPPTAVQALPSDTAAPEPAAAAATPEPSAEPLPPSATSQPAAVDVEALPDPAGYRWAQVADGFEQPLGLAHAGDGRLFVVEQRGVIWVLQDLQRLGTPLLDIRQRVNSGAFEQGLLGLAFHPDFASNGYLYANYTDASGDTAVSRFTAAPGGSQADPASERVLLQIDQPFSNHNGGGLLFGPDGYLYIGTGDGGSAADPFGNAQSLDTLLGKLLRIDVDGGDPYGVPPDNPFAGGGGRAEIWAYGLRNPWRFAFDPQGGDLYIGDVGQNAWEEIDFLPAGSPGGVNFGWNHREGRHAFASSRTEGLTDPVAEYANAGSACSVTGGVVVRDPALPAWSGVYLYGDYCSGEVWGLVRDQAGVWHSELLFQTGLNISSFGADADGQAYLVHHRGALYRLEAEP